MIPEAATPTQRPRLSVAMIVRDEADVLPATLASVRSVAEEIVVLDTGSSDATVATARQLGCIVEPGVWDDDFSAARNRCLQMASGDWVLWLDAGEQLDAATAGELRTFIDQTASPQWAYLVLVEVPAADPTATSEQSACLRLMPRRAELQFEGRVRETLRPALEQAGMSVDVAPGRIVRHARQHDPERKARRAQRNLDLITLEAADVQDYPPRLLLALGEAYADSGNLEGARNAFLEAIARTTRGSTAMLEAYYGLLAAMDTEEQRSMQLSTCLEALEIFPFDGQLLMAMGNYLQAHGRLDMAVRSFEAAVDHGRVNLETWHLRDLSEMASICLSLSHQTLGDAEQASNALRDAVARHPSSARLKRYWIELLAKLGRREMALHLIDQLTMDSACLQTYRDTVMGVCAFVRKELTQAQGYLQRAYSGGYREPFCLRWLALTLLSLGQRAAAEPVLREWEQREPHSAEARTCLDALQARSSMPVSASSSVQGATARRLRMDGADTPASPAIPTSGSVKVRLGS